MIHPLHTFACAVRRWRTLRRVGYDPMPSLAGGRYYLAIGTRGPRSDHEYELSRDDMEMLAEALTELLASTRPDGRGGWQWFDRQDARGES